VSVSKESSKLPASRGNKTQHKKQRKEKQAKNREAKSADLLVQGFNDAAAKMLGAADALKEKEKVVSENNIDHLKKTIDRLEQEKAELKSQTLSKDAQIDIDRKFSLRWDEEYESRIIDVSYASTPAFLLLGIKIVIFVFGILLTIGIENLAVFAYFAMIPPALWHCVEFLPMFLLLFMIYSMKMPGYFNWRFYLKLYRKAITFTLCFVFSFFFPIVMKKFPIGLDPVSASLFDMLFTYCLYVAHRCLSTNYLMFKLSKRKRHRYLVDIPEDDVLNADLRPESLKRGKLVFSDPMETSAHYTMNFVDVCDLAGVDTFSGDPVLAHWEMVYSDAMVDKYGRKDFKISLEMLAQLNHLATMMPAEKSIAYERIEFAAKNIVSVNTDKYDFTEGNHLSLHTVLLAKALYHQQRESVSEVPF
jgi:hypothetical protein